MKTRVIIALIFVLGVSTIYAQEKIDATLLTNSLYKEQVVSLLKSLETDKLEVTSMLNTRKYTQHNPYVEDGLKGFVKFVQQLTKGETTVNTVRVFQDEDYVFAHSEYNVYGPKIGFDIFRFVQGKIVEHWDNLQERQKNNPSNHTMIDGVTVLRDTEKIAQNKALVKNFVDDILVNGRYDKMTNYFDGDTYIQHNPCIGDGLSGLNQALEEWAKQGVMMSYTKVHKILGEGNFVLVVSEGLLGGVHTSFYDLFRVENDKIIEHWDTLETISKNQKELKNQNGKFGFLVSF